MNLSGSEWRVVPVTEAQAWMTGEPTFNSVSVYDAVHTVIVQGQQIAALQHLVSTVIAVHSKVSMDTPEDKALHAKAIETFSAAARALGVKP